MILDRGDRGRYFTKYRYDSSYTAILFGDHYVTQVKENSLKNFKDGFKEKFEKCSLKEFLPALEEAFKVFTEINKITIDFQEFLTWSTGDFEATFSVEFRWINQELPKMVQDALNHFKETSAEFEEKGDLVRILTGRNLDLRDLCIACGTGIYELTVDCPNNLVFRHPLFYGSICLFCVSNIAKVCYLPWDKVKELCIICGLDDYLVIICSKEDCSKSYCQDCVESLDHEKAFITHAENVHWVCYFCKQSDNPSCLIQKRNLDETNEHYKPPPPYPALDDNGNYVERRASGEDSNPEHYAVENKEIQTEVFHSDVEA